MGELLPFNNATNCSMPNVVPNNSFRHLWRPQLYRSYGQKFEWRAQGERLESKDQPTMKNDGGTKTLRFRPNVRGGKATLPLPPVMDPIAVSARYRDRGPKAKMKVEAYEETSEFRRALAVNPYARALATPVRNCTVTRARLPTHFLQPLTAHFRVQDNRLKAYIYPQNPHTPKDFELKGEPAGTLPSKTYALNSRDVINTIGRKQRNLQLVISPHMRDAADERARALGKGSAKGEDWTWLGEEDGVREILQHGVNEALMNYITNEPQFPKGGHIFPITRLEGMEYAVFPDLKSAGRWRQRDGEASDDMLIAAYDFTHLQMPLAMAEIYLPEMLGGADTELCISYHKSTLDLHMALQRLAMFLGAQSALKWIVVKKEELADSGLDDHFMDPFL